MIGIVGGAGPLILACSEIPLAISGDSYHGIPLIDSTQILATALIENYRN